MSEVSYTVTGMTCAHCKQAVSSELGNVPGVSSVEIDLDSKQVLVHGESLDDLALRAAIEKAGYEAG